jgi:hypothetical protein
MYRNVLVISAVIVLSGCAEMGTKQDAFPAMYSPQKPVSIVVVPAINESTAADAGDLLNVTVTQPFANHGYYVLPVPIVADIFRREGILQGEQVRNVPARIFKENFGADSVLFMTIESWDKTYMVLAANVTVGIEYVLVSTTTSEVLWSYEQQVVVDTSGGSGNIIADLVTTAVATGLADYVPVAAQVHDAAAKALPYGSYHPRSGTDGAEKNVNLKLRENALAAD